MDGKTKGIAAVLLAALGFSGMSVCVHLAGDLPSMQKAFFRNFVALLVTGILLIRTHTKPIPRKGSAAGIFFRSLFGTVGIVCNFYAIDRLVLADANMLNKLSPFFAVLFSAILLKEKPHIVQILGLIVAFVGSIFIIKPTGGYTVWPALVGATGGLGAGMAYTFVRKLGKNHENGVIIVFWFSVFSCLVCLPFLILSAVPMTLFQVLSLIGAGICACIGQFGITRAYFYAPAKEISVYDYAQVLFAALFGFLIFRQIPDLYSVIGYVLICGAGIGMFFFNKRKSA